MDSDAVMREHLRRTNWREDFSDAVEPPSGYAPLTPGRCETCYSQTCSCKKCHKSKCACPLPEGYVYHPSGPFIYPRELAYWLTDVTDGGTVET